ncbi:hypothetical protein [Nostoc sp.]
MNYKFYVLFSNNFSYQNIKLLQHQETCLRSQFQGNQRSGIIRREEAVVA